MSQTLDHPVLLSLSRAIEGNKNAYYAALEKAQKGNEVNEWVRDFVALILEAQKQAKEWIDFILKKSRFFDRFKDKLNERQLKVVIRMFEAGLKGFEGGMSARKYISITKTSKATATRDL